ncbi:MAG: sulfatase-like hydrolase/transferase, partial [Planctomycetota bacterium]
MTPRACFVAVFNRAKFSVLLGLIVLAAVAADAAERPNILLVMADDVGWEAFGCYGGEDYQTPRLDDLAARGVRFAHCYSTPICTTSRVQIMTGKYNLRNYTHFGYLDPDEPTFGQLLRSAGYRTAIAGKWQLNGLYNSLPGHDDPSRVADAGFDEYCLWQVTQGKQTGGERYWSPLLETHKGPRSAVDNDGLYGPDLMSDFLCEFMTRDDDRPFFAYYPMVLVHSPFVPTPASIGDGKKSNKPGESPDSPKTNFAAMVEYMDAIVGRLVDTLDEAGKLDNTLILFTADNGTNRKLTSRWNGRDIKGGKGTTPDAGTHVPLIAYWRGRGPTGVVTDDLVDFTDFYPTLAEAAGATPPDGHTFDGVSFLPRIRGETATPRDW